MLDLFIDVTSIAFVLVPLLAFGFAHSFSKSGWNLIADLAQPIGVVGTIIGMVGILQNVSDPEILPLVISISLLTIGYAVIISGLTSSEEKEHSDLYSSGTKKGIATAVALGVVLWGMDAAAGLEAFIDLQSAISVLVGILLLLSFDKVLGNSVLNGWGQRLLGIGLIFFMAGSIAMLVNLNDPRAMGPAMAWAMLSLLYCLILLIIGRIWFPALVTDSRRNLGTNFLTFTLPFLIGMSFQVALLLLAFN